ncbi:hypothetical protein PoB_001528100 [Plakobranchus ocellatus]|uniref:Uncharacterized protein n=1 Tax=Plakobranchus ocellatus TaxID=259542 RepID=A0AAV3YNP5_9GAST|nr:hypothetical protein PoB_001528100 [Plakobranchus ocellatus]
MQQSCVYIWHHPVTGLESAGLNPRRERSCGFHFAQANRDDTGPNCLTSFSLCRQIIRVRAPTALLDSYIRHANRPRNLGWAIHKNVQCMSVYLGGPRGYTKDASNFFQAHLRASILRQWELGHVMDCVSSECMSEWAWRWVACGRVGEGEPSYQCELEENVILISLRKLILYKVACCQGAMMDWSRDHRTVVSGGRGAGRSQTETTPVTLH